MIDPANIGPKMEALSNSGNTFTRVPRELDVESLGDEPSVYGTRWVEVEATDGSVGFEQVPLHWDDLFDPQEGDWLVQGYEHGSTTGNIASALRCLLKARGHEDVVVYEDVNIQWQTPGVSSVCPDVTVVFGITEEQARKSESFDERKEGVSPSFLLEVTSKTTARFDRKKKPTIFRQGKAREYLRVDRLKSPWKLAGERRSLETGRYRKIRPDRQGRLLSRTLEVYFSISESGDELILEDARTGEVLRTPIQEFEDRRTAERQAAEEAEARAAAQRQAAEEAEARAAAERQTAEEAKARTAAERQAAEEAKARTKEARARAAAERQAAEEAEARAKEARARAAAQRQATEEAEARAKEAEARAAAERQAAEEAEARAKEARARAAAEAKVQELLAKIEHLESIAD